jgi:hypothetical protein
MLKKLQYFWQLSYQRSPQENLEALRNNWIIRLIETINKLKLIIRRIDQANTVIPDLWINLSIKNLLPTNYKFITNHCLAG